MPSQRSINSTNTNARSTSVQDIIERNKRNKRNIKIEGPRNNNNILGKDSFLKLLIKQLEHQDPLKPSQDKEFIAQIAQFSSLEQMKNIASEISSLKKYQANSFIGKVITGQDFVNKTEVHGLVSNIIFDRSGNVFLRVNNRNVKMEDILSVQNKKQNVSRETSKQVQVQNVSRETSEQIQAQKAYSEINK